MAVSDSKFKNSRLDLIRRVEARYTAAESASARPWQQLRALGGELRAKAQESVLSEEDFGDLR